MGRETQVELTNMCMVCKGDEVLVQEHVGRNWPGIAFPGGHVEPGESVTDSVIREIKEETGLTIQHPRLRGIKDWTREDGSRYLVFLFRAEEFSGALTSSEEGRAFWVKREELPRMDLARSMKETLAVIEGDGLSEMYFTVQAQITEGDHWALL